VTSDYERWGLLTAVHKLVGRARAIELAKHGLTPEQSHVLHILDHRGGSTTLKEIARVELVQHNAVSTLVRRMEQVGLVERKRKPGTSEYEIRITEKGRMLAETVPKASVDLIFEALSVEEKHLLVVCLEKLDRKARHMLGLDYLPPF
jgi:DNA-binding MarR family transcriptional regulator